MSLVQLRPRKTWVRKFMADENRICSVQLNSSETATQFILSTKDVAARLCVASSTLNAWLQEDDARMPQDKLFRFHRWVGNRRRWSEDGYRMLELAVHYESENGVLARVRTRTARCPADPDAEMSLAEVLDPKDTRTF